MKKNLILVLTLIVILVASVCILTACDKDEATVKSYEIAEKEYSIGDKFATSDVAVTANLTDGTTKKCTNNIVVDDSAIESKLDEDSKFVDGSAGTYTLKVYAVEIRDDLLIGEWKVIVSE